MEAPDLQDWSISHGGYTAWMAHSLIPSSTNVESSYRAYIVDIHVGEDAVNPRLWPVITPFLSLEVRAPDPDQGAMRLTALFKSRAEEWALPPATDYLQVLPPVEESVASPVQAALDSAIPLDLDHPQEDIDVMNEGRKGERLTAPA